MKASKYYFWFSIKARALLGLVLFSILILNGAPVTAMPATDTLDPELKTKVNEMAPGEMLRVIVFLRRQVDVRRNWGENRQSRLQNLNLALQYNAEIFQKNIRVLLQSRIQKGHASNPVYFWIFNGFSVLANQETILDLASMPEVKQIRQEWQFSMLPDSLTPEQAQPNIEQISAPEVWVTGYRGQGVVVASLDSGVSMSHDDLVSRWRGGTNSWYDPFNQHPGYPIDLSGHGTAVMGIMVAGEVNGTAMGVAPAAQWIAARIFDDRGFSTETAIHLAFQWLLDPDGDPATADAPHVVNNSWGSTTPGCNLAYQADLQALVAAGILPVFSAGNFGPMEGTGTSPGNYPDALAVGAVDDADIIWPLSSRGPSDCGEPAAIFPEVVAPGVAIYTFDRAGTFATRTGTSMAAPHASGVLALLLSAYPGTSVQDQRQALLQTALDLGDTGADNTYGYGRLDAMAAYNWLAINYKTPTPTLTPTFTPTPITPAPAAYYLPEIFQQFLPTPMPGFSYLPQIYYQYNP
jgi:hypothetical protein